MSQSKEEPKIEKSTISLRPSCTHAEIVPNQKYCGIKHFSVYWTAKLMIKSSKNLISKQCAIKQVFWTIKASGRDGGATASDGHLVFYSYVGRLLFWLRCRYGCIQSHYEVYVEWGNVPEGLSDESTEGAMVTCFWFVILSSFCTTNIKKACITSCCNRICFHRLKVSHNCYFPKTFSSTFV